MRDVLLELQSASPHEAASGPNYFWDNRVRPPRGAILQYTWNGQGRLRRGKQICTCGPGQALLMLQGDATAYYFPDGCRTPWEYAWVNILGAELLCSELIRRYGDVITLDQAGETVGLIKQLTRLYHDKAFFDRYHTSELLGRLLSSLARELGHVRAEDQSPVRQAQDFLRDHHRRPINIKEVAARFDLSREHFARIFHEETGETPAVFLRQLRLSTARRLLRGTHMSVLEVAEQSGFGSSTHFCRAFRAVEKQSPDTYRKRQRV